MPFAEGAWCAFADCCGLPGYTPAGAAEGKEDDIRLESKDAIAETDARARICGGYW